MVVEFVAEWAVSIIASIDYIGVFLLMALESMIFPIPSEIVMPLSGYLIARGEFDFFWVILFSTLGSVFGSLISYVIGYVGGRKVIQKIGKYLLLNEEHLTWTENFFKKHGQKTIFISRFIPVIRHLISIPAGIGKMNIKRFTFYTFVGAGIWNTFLAWLGYILSDKLLLISKYSRIIDIFILVLLVICIVLWLYSGLKKKTK